MKDYDEVKRMIDEWDPIDLLNIAPSDEYEYEVNQIIALLNHNLTENELAAEIFEVFKNEFGDGVFTKDENECFDIARKILKK